MLVDFGSRLRLRGTAVFVYHGLTNSSTTGIPSPKGQYWIEGALFKEHLNQVHVSGYLVVPLEASWNRAGEHSQAGLKTVLTFDDGRASDYEIAYPLLLEAGVSATFFVNTATIGARGYLDWPNIAEMQRAGMSFQSHGHEHVDLSRLSAPALEQQLRYSKRQIEDRLGSSVAFLAAPFGRMNRHVIAAARGAGYQAVCSSRAWPARPGAHRLNRVVTYRHTTPTDFRRLLERRLLTYLDRAARWPLYWPNIIRLRLRRTAAGQGLYQERA